MTVYGARYPKKIKEKLKLKLKEYDTLKNAIFLFFLYLKNFHMFFLIIIYVEQFFLFYFI
jgi:hypothetical protein